MTKRADPFQIVRTLALAMPDVEESTYWGVPALKVRGRPFACMASHSSAEPNTLVVWTDRDQRDDLIAEAPAVYYLKEHYQEDYQNCQLVLVRLAKIQPDALRDLLIAARQVVAANAPARKPQQRKLATKSRRSRRTDRKGSRKTRR